MRNLTEIIEKIKRLATGGVGGERYNAQRILDRLAAKLNEPANDDLIELIPVTMRVPTERGIYAPSALRERVTLEKERFRHLKPIGKMLVSFEVDGESSPVEMDYYSGYFIVLPNEIAEVVRARLNGAGRKIEVI